MVSLANRKLPSMNDGQGVLALAAIIRPTAAMARPEQVTSLPPPARVKGDGPYTPKLVTVMREGYSLSRLQGDLVAGLTVAVVALPLAMALGIASGASPDRGLAT